MSLSLRSAALGAAAAFSLLTVPASAQVMDAVPVATGLTRPILATAPDGDPTRLFIAQQRGLIRLVKNGTLQATPFLDLSSLVSSSGNERGLLGMAFHPDYLTNGYFYVSYTRASGHASVVIRYEVSANPDIANPLSATTIYGPITQPFSNHNGGCIAFGADGKLYLGLGDGGSANDPGNRSQTTTNPLGKILRFDVDIAFPHIPADNPFVGNPSTLDEIWSIGVRNPWRFSFDRLTGDMYMGDVGQFAREEVNFEPAGMGGLNYGWRCMEGFNCTGLSGCTCNSAPLTLPLHDYNHGGGRCSITGGYVYRGCDIPAFNGLYFFGDYCSGQVWTAEVVNGVWQNLTERTADLGGVGLISSFGQDANGEIYIVNLNGTVYKIVPQGGGPTGPVVYCTAQVNSQGCTPAIGFSGTPASGETFKIDVVNTLNQKNGLLFYGLAPKNAPFLGGTLCVNQPLKRTPVQASGGSAVGDDCTGTFSYDFGARITAGTDPTLVGGQPVYAQYWSRDPQAAPASTTNLTDALEFVVCY